MVRTDRDPEGNPAQWHDFVQFVRRALHAAADQVEPQADGLEPIRAKIPAWSGLRRGQPVRRHPHLIRRRTRRGGPGNGAPGGGAPGGGAPGR
jgi:hypothetical protein